MRMNSLKLLIEDFHSTTAATTGDNEHPQTRVIDMMLWDNSDVYFLNAKGKEFLYTAYGTEIYSSLSHKKTKEQFLCGEQSKISEIKSLTIFLKRIHV